MVCIGCILGVVDFFFYLNWEYISNPYLNPYYSDRTSVFNYNEALANFSDTGFWLPGKIISYTVYLQSLLLFSFLIKNDFTLSIRKWAIILSTILIAVFSDLFFEIIGLTNELKHTTHEIVIFFDWFLLYTVIFSMFFSFVGSIVHLIITRLKNNIGFMFLGVFSAVMFFTYVFLYMELFFD